MFTHFSMAYETQLGMKTNHWKSWQISKRQIKLDLLLDYAGAVQIYQSHGFFALLTWIGQNSPKTKASEIRRLKMGSFGRPFIAGLCFTVKLIHREIVLEMDNTTGDGEQQEKAAPSLEVPAGLTLTGAGQPMSRAWRPRLRCAGRAGRFHITCRNYRDYWALYNRDESLELCCRKILHRER